MTIYLFIDLPFNGNSCYPTSLRDEKKKEEKIRGGGGKAVQLLGGQLISCFSCWLFSTWIQSHSVNKRKYGQEIQWIAIQTRALLSLYYLCSYKNPLLYLHFFSETSFFAITLYWEHPHPSPQPLISGLWSETHLLLSPTLSAYIRTDRGVWEGWASRLFATTHYDETGRLWCQSKH